MNMPLDDPRRALAHKMALLARNWRQLADGALAEFGVSNSAGWCLIHLDRLGADVRQADLAESLYIRQPSLVRTLDLLQANGLVARARPATSSVSRRETRPPTACSSGPVTTTGSRSARKPRRSS